MNREVFRGLRICTGPLCDPVLDCSVSFVVDHLEVDAMRRMTTVYVRKPTYEKSPCSLLVLQMHLLGIHPALYIQDIDFRIFLNAYLFVIYAERLGLVLEFGMN